MRIERPQSPRTGGALGFLDEVALIQDEQTRILDLPKLEIPIGYPATGPLKRLQCDKNQAHRPRKRSGAVRPRARRFPADPVQSPKCRASRAAFVVPPTSISTRSKRPARENSRRRAAIHSICVASSPVGISSTTSWVRRIAPHKTAAGLSRQDSAAPDFPPARPGIPPRCSLIKWCTSEVLPRAQKTSNERDGQTTIHSASYITLTCRIGKNNPSSRACVEGSVRVAFTLKRG